LVEDNLVRALIVLIAGAFLSAGVQFAMTPNFSRTTTIASLVVGGLFFLVGFYWPRLAPDLNVKFVETARSVASDFRWWLAVVGCIWLYMIGTYALFEIRRNNEIMALRNARF
jgi:hypothetical protein